MSLNVDHTVVKKLKLSPCIDELKTRIYDIVYCNCQKLVESSEELLFYF